jgi:hypothetical protein
MNNDKIINGQNESASASELQERVILAINDEFIGRNKHLHHHSR